MPKRKTPVSVLGYDSRNVSGPSPGSAGGSVGLAGGYDLGERGLLRIP